MTRRHPRTFGRARPYISPRARRARRQARTAACCLAVLALPLFAVSYTLMSDAADQYGKRFGDLTGAAMLFGMAGFALLFLAVLAASEA